MHSVFYLSLYNRTNLINRWRVALISLWVMVGLTSHAVAGLTRPTTPALVEATPAKPGKKVGKTLGRKMGRASWYGPRFHGKKTAAGERFNQHHLTAAHRRLPLGTQVEVTNLKNGRKVRVRINDRGPYVKGRVIDLSRAAAQRLGMLASGTTPVRIEVQPE